MMNRRRFTKSLALGLGGLGLASLTNKYWLHATPWAPSSAAYVTAYGTWRVGETLNYSPGDSSLIFFRESDFARTTYPCPFRAHSVLQNPLNSDQIFVIGSVVDQIGLFDRRKGQFTSLETTLKNRQFFGHAAWDSAEGGFWVTESNLSTHQGLLSLRGPDLKIIREIPTYGKVPHEVRMLEGGVLLVANIGANSEQQANDSSIPSDRRISNLSWVRARDGELLKQIQFPESLGRAGVTHFAIRPKTNDIFLVSTLASKELETVVFHVRSDGTYKMVQPEPSSSEQFRGEGVSITYMPSEDMVYWTLSSAKGVFAMPAQGGGEAKLIYPSQSKGLAVHGDELLVTLLRPNKMMGYSKKYGAREIAAPPEFPGAQWGSHLTYIEG